jgi:hypothetical protein
MERQSLEFGCSIVCKWVVTSRALDRVDNSVSNSTQIKLCIYYHQNMFQRPLIDYIGLV